MLQPKKTKFRRQQKGRMKGLAQRGNQLVFGSFGIKTLENCWLTGRQIEAARQAVVRYMKREGKIWIRIFHGCFLILTSFWHCRNWNRESISWQEEWASRWIGNSCIA